MNNYRLKLFLLGLSLSALIISCAGNRDSDSPFYEDQLVMESNERVAAYAIPNIVTTPKGTILCFATARIGDNHDWGNVMEIALVRSTDNGVTWEDPRTIAAIENWTVRQSSAIVDTESGKIMVFGHKSPLRNTEGDRMSEMWRIANPEADENLGSSQIYIESIDDGKTWSEIKEIKLPYWPHDPGIVLKVGKFKGRFILPARTIKGKVFDWNNLYNGVLISDDKGRTWRAGGLTQSHVGEASVVELSDGAVYINSRNHAENFGIRNHAISYDGGENFTEFGDDPQLIEPTCDAGLAQYNDPKFGNVVLFSNPAVSARKRWDGPSRRRMTVKASFDDCKTWPNQKLIFVGPSSYSGITVGKEGWIFLVYERAALGSNDSRENIAISKFNLAWLKEEEVDPPVITPPNKVFFQTQRVEIVTDDNSEVRYTIDGSTLDGTSNLYSEPFELNESSVVKAVSISNQISSIVTTGSFIKSNYNAPVYTIPYNEKYPGSGELSLVDGIEGSLNYSDGKWQGFEEVDFEVVVDLTSLQELNNISINFLQSTDFWIFAPEYVKISYSTDGREFTQIKKIVNNTPIKDADLSIQNYSVDMQNIKAQYIKIFAKNIGTCPTWHKGNGGKAWLFVDEVTIDTRTGSTKGIGNSQY